MLLLSACFDELMKNFTMVSLAFFRVPCTRSQFALMKKSKPVSSLLINCGRRRDGVAVVP